MPFKKRSRFVFWTILCCCLSRPAFSKTPPEIRIETQKHVLENGLTVLITEMPSHPVVSFYALVKTGSATEGKLLGAGLSHFMEHMLFKGTEKRGVGVISREVQSLGGMINASTSLDYTVFTLTVPQGKFFQALDILSDTVSYTHLTLPTN